MKATSRIVIVSALVGLTALIAVALAQKQATPSAQTGTVADGRSFTNRLVNEKSPYLIQHAHNPVDWYPWGEEADTGFETVLRRHVLSASAIHDLTGKDCGIVANRSGEN